MKLNSACPKIIRVYGESQERNIFPLPRFLGNASMTRGYELQDKREYKDIALHYLIRKPGRKYADEIREFDERFQNNIHIPENISKYQKLLKEASAEELKNYEIILCTCPASTNSRLLHGSLVIIDECGMCKEPECLLPLLNHPHARQVVLIGDHKQLQPIVKNRTAAEKGLQTSLFERYGEQSFMLNKQYRMHESICHFPSRHFYQNKLITAISKPVQIPQFWPNTSRPVVFCHVEGAERSLSVSTEEGNESSKSNDLEMKEAVRIFRELRSMRKISQICILSQYKAQCHLIESELRKTTDDENYKVCTVVSSQGNEWDFVILSLVRSMPEYEIEKNPSIGWCKRNLGFISDEHQINVALTRAKHGLIIIGNKNLLQCDKMWKSLLKEYQQNNCIVDALTFVPSFNRMKQNNPQKRFGATKNRKNV
ncbi:hypothetical protein HELRODRAFT_71671 [Helobdella robusta]|uniref:DNA2/NAM7 helicase-like C-terminal domain-containing protein n=1 Tax=Helobdella robusta TaxID=6412 RepID=T1G0Q0_HELRO|nr:hypothetical protein HELRODRAFT_71671 [Helobdella robusta]ESO11598.1 hypothetical protein HELRODRAFT_71671 [Helobdella robusta]